MLLAFGLAIAAVAVLILVHYRDARAFRIDLIIAGVLVVLGALMRLSRK